MGDLDGFVSYCYEMDLPDNMPLDNAIEGYLVHLHFKRGWQWQTLMRFMGGLIGVFVNLTMYTRSSLTANPMQWPRFRALMTAARRKANECGHREPQNATADDIVKALKFATSQLRGLLVLCWASAQRPCDVLQLRTKNVTLLPDGTLTALFVEGKTISALQPHHIHATVPQAMCEDLRAFLDASDTFYLFPLGSEYKRTQVMRQMRDALRAVRPELEARSIRRGTLCAMAKRGATERELMTWSRHTSPKALWRYLGYEKIPPAEHREMQRKSREGLQPSDLDGEIEGGDTPSSAPRFDGLISRTEDGDVMFHHSRAPRAARPDANTNADIELHYDERCAVPVDMEKLAEMARHSHDPAVGVEFLLDRQECRNDDGRYDKVPFNGQLAVAHGVLEDQARVFEELGVWRRVHEHEMHRIRGTVIITLRPEHVVRDGKLISRLRKITWTKAYNDTYAKDVFAHDRGNATRDSSRSDVLDCEGATVLDFRAWFDFLPLSDDVSWYECFVTDWGVTYRNMRVAMGKRSSTTVGTSATRVIGSFPIPAGVKFRYATDGVRFAGPRAAVADAAWQYVQRAWSVGAVIKDLDVASSTKEDVDALYRCQDSDWLGDLVDFTKKTIRCRDKHVDRLRQFAD
ncbi:MAG: hypothetical protein AAB263_08755, partial [Planctomycetota bacterium]